MALPFLSSSSSSSSSSYVSSILIALIMVTNSCFSDYYKAVVAAAEDAVLKNRTIPAIIVFGDSIVDSGNNNNIKTLIKCNFPPYGKDFMGGRSTGRFSNGKVPSDLIAQIYGVKEYVPAYLDPNLSIQDLVTGVSFASGGTGFDPLTPKVVSVLSLSDQLDLFKKYLEKLKGAVGEERTATILSQGLFVICAGSDDIANTYYSTPLRSAEYDVASYTDLMVHSASSFVQQLYGLGVRKMAVFSAPPIGCVPSQRTSGGGILRGCAESRNQAALLYNSKLSSRLDALSKQLQQGSKIKYLDVYHPLLDIIQNPTQYGFEEASKGCCGTGIIEVTMLCNRYSPGTCSDVSKYVFWDSYHPTQNTYTILVQKVFTKSGAEFF